MLLVGVDGEGQLKMKKRERVIVGEMEGGREGGRVDCLSRVC